MTGLFGLKPTGCAVATLLAAAAAGIATPATAQSLQD
jgi:hypothetical protein